MRASRGGKGENRRRWSTLLRACAGEWKKDYDVLSYGGERGFSNVARGVRRANKTTAVAAGHKVLHDQAGPTFSSVVVQSPILSSANTWRPPFFFILHDELFGGRLGTFFTPCFLARIQSFSTSRQIVTVCLESSFLFFSSLFLLILSSYCGRCRVPLSTNVLSFFPFLFLF